MIVMRTSMMTLLIASAFAVGISGDANAAAIAGAIAPTTGHNVWDYNSEWCMRSTWLMGGIKNDCSTSQLWEVDGTVSTTGTKQIVISGNLNPIGEVHTQCIGYVINNFGLIASQSNWTSFGNGYSTTISTTAFYLYNISATDRIQVQCQIPPGNKIVTIYYTP